MHYRLNTSTETPNDTLEMAIDEAIALYISRCNQNLDRVQTLINLHKLADHLGTTANRGADDVLRSAVVFLHASLEELLRQVAVNFLPYANESVLNEIPLVGMHSRAEKFLLGKLSKHRGKSVDALITESVQEYLETSNFNNITEITRLLQSLNIPIDQLRELFPVIAELMERRHQIVHRADRFEQQGKVELRPLTAETVMQWLNAVHKLVDGLSLPIVREHLIKNGTLVAYFDSISTNH